MFFLGNILNYFRSSAQRMNIHPTCSVQGNYLGRAFIFAYSWNFEYKLRSTFLETQYSSLKEPPGMMVYVPTPLSLLLPRSLLLSHLPQFWSAHAGSAGWWDEPGREAERTPEAHCCSKNHREQAAREDDVSSLSEWLTWVGQLKETALGSPSAESALSFPGSLN